MSDPAPAANKAPQAPQKPVVKYRVELEKRLDINKSYKDYRSRAVALRILSFGLFGKKRFQNLYLSCSLNCFYWGLQIANFLHQRVANLAMIIKFEEVHVIEYYENPNENGKGYTEQKYTKILIKLTRNPTEEDKKQSGYNAGLQSKDIKQELTQIIQRKEGARRPQQQRGQRRPRNNENRRNQGDRRDRNEGQDRRRNQGERRPQRDNRNDRDERPRRNDREEDRRPRRQNRDQDSRPRREDRDQNRPQRRYQDEEQPRYRSRQNEQAERREPTQKRYEERGAPKTRGGPSSSSRPANSRHADERNDRPRQEERGDRRPKASRYSSDDD